MNRDITAQGQQHGHECGHHEMGTRTTWTKGSMGGTQGYQETPGDKGSMGQGQRGMGTGVGIPTDKDTIGQGQQQGQEYGPQEM